MSKEGIEAERGSEVDRGGKECEEEENQEREIERKRA